MMNLQLTVSVWLGVTSLLSCDALLDQGPTCYMCSAISNPNDCRTQHVCGFGETCFTERRISSSLGETFTLGCESSEVCARLGTGGLVGKRNAKTPTSKRDVSVCTQCCSGNNCNSVLCNTAGSGSVPAQQEVYVRLIGGGNAFEGTVEVYYNGQWGAICDDGWSGHDAGVICKMLGYSDVGAGGMSGGLYRTNNQSRIWLDEVHCTGRESSIADCPKSPWGMHDCSHREDAAVLCQSVSPHDDVIYVTDINLGGTIFRMNLLTQSYVPIPLSVYHINTFDYDPVEGRLYFSDPIVKQIASAHFDGTDAREVRQLDINAVVDTLEVDPLSRMLFFTDDGNNVIASMNMDGSDFKEIITSGLDKPRDILVDPRNRKVYWSDYGAHPKIEVANYDGSGRRTLVSTGLHWPNGMAIDYDENLLYFTDGAMEKIEVVDLQGNNRRQVLRDPGSLLFSLDVFDQYLYYTDWNQNTIMRVNKDGSGKVNVGPPSFQKLSDLRVHRFRNELPGVSTQSPVQLDREHVFVRIHGPLTQGYVEVYANGQWGTICDDHWDDRDAQVICRMVGINADGARAVTNAHAGHGNSLILLDEVGCHGDEEHILDCGISASDWASHDCSHNEDAGVLCNMDNTEDNFLVFATPGLLNFMSMSTYSYTVIPVPGTQPNPIAMDMDFAHRRLYFTEVMLYPGSKIYSMDIDGDHPVLLKQLPASSVADGLAIDTVNGKLFYTDTGRDVIASMNLDGTGETTLISSQLDEPRAIVLDPENRVMYWTDWGASPKIEKANYDGSGRTTLVSSAIDTPNGLAFDRQSGLLYFADAGTHMIESIDTEGNQRQVVFRDNSAHFFGLFLTRNYIYYSDWNRHGLMRLNKDGSGQTMAGPPSFTRISGVTGHPGN